ncbi:Endonuclease 8 1 [Maioricimonas rarisocia]|uniref:DNA-(apurinic or apyrimidinic site) lyase n=1 Tax=Maioricimonas rarisocia TaxID=2528026 RepID=A0A517Z5S1_9PLAN|nr:DNA-formamidopyrimidine glycosylase family protein [Maioricimonas rarisocia]QDU37791.1 Endonuclease 8 1 [Maioricimonas rarisocia]
MPEGHTIHRLAGDHRKHFAGTPLQLRSPQGRFADEAKLLDGQTLLDVEAWGKHLFYRWERGEILHIHLGLYGKFRPHRVPLPEPRGQVRLRAWNDARGFDLNGPNQCELISDAIHADIMGRLGEDPLRPDADPDRLWDRIRRSRAAIGRLLLDQSVVAGVGNVYRAEVLFLHGLHPERQARTLSRVEFDALWETLVRLLKLGVKYNRIITADAADFGKTPSRLTREERLLVYKRAECRRCSSAIEDWKLGARTIYACPTCQPLQEA